jgi:hypothetical protein
MLAAVWSYFFSRLGRRGGGEHVAAQVAAQPAEFVDGGRDRRLPVDPHPQGGIVLRIDLAAAPSRARIAALQRLLRDLDVARPAVGGRSVAPVPSHRFLPLRFRLLLAAAVHAGPFEHRSGFLGRGRAQPLAQFGQGRLLLFQ